MNVPMYDRLQVVRASRVCGIRRQLPRWPSWIWTAESVAIGESFDPGVGVKRTLYIVLGLLNVGLGSVGLFLPLLPTTPFLLLAAFLFARSSPRWHQWLLSHKHLGPYIHAFRGRTGLTRAQKFRITASFTVVFAVSIYLVPAPAMKVGLAAGWLFWTVFIYRIRPASTPALATRGAAP